MKTWRLGKIRKFRGNDRFYSRAEGAADAAIHVLGELFAITGGLWLLFHATGRSFASVSVYCAGLLAMLTASAAYNLWPRGNVKDWLRRCDHAAIFVMIAGTYTPFAVDKLEQPTGKLILVLIWLAAMIGIGLKVLAPRRFEIAGIGLYLGMGWLIVAVLKSLSVSVAPTDFWLLVGGGLVYSAGVIFYVIERIPYHKVIWHGLVLAGVALHFAAIAGEFAA